MLKRNLFAALTIFLSLMVLSPSHAAFSFKEKQPEPEKPGTDLDLTGDDAIVLAQIGPGEKEKKQSRGRDIALPLALELLTPDGWKIIVSDEYREKKVSWQSGPDGEWLEVLESIGTDEGLRFVVNWESMEIAAGKGKIKELAEKTDTSEIKTGQRKGNSNFKELSAEKIKEEGGGLKEKAVTVAKEPWTLVSGRLKDQLSQWCERADYTLIWDNKYDYQVEAGQTFYGSFEKAVDEVISALYHNGARVKADIYTENQVLYISGDSERQ